MIRGISAFVLLGMLLAASLPSRAGESDISLPTNFAQPAFNTLVKELGIVVGYNAVAPAESLGITGFDIAVAVTGVELDEQVWNQVVSDGSAPSVLPVPRLIVRKGLPFGIDLGVNYTEVQGSNITIMGGEIRKSLVEGSSVYPALSVSLHTSRLEGVDDLDLKTYGVDLGISKGFAMLTPYAGIGQLWIDGSENIPFNNLHGYQTSITRSNVGVRIGLLPVMSLTLQADFSETNSYNVKLGIDF